MDLDVAERARMKVLERERRIKVCREEQSAREMTFEVGDSIGSSGSVFREIGELGERTLPMPSLLRR